MAQRVALINMKGGVGKTTLSVQLAYWFAEFRLKNVLVVDLDPQFNATQCLLGDLRTRQVFEEKRPTIWHVFESEEPHPKSIKREETQDAILELAYSLMNPKGKEHRLSDFLMTVDDTFDLILIDCAPTLSLLTTAAYNSANHLDVPVKPEYLSTIGLSLLVRSLSDFAKGRSPKHSKPKLAGIVFAETENYSPEETIAKAEVEDLAKKQKWKIFEHQMPFSRSFAKGPRHHAPIHRTPHARRKMKDRFAALAQEFGRSIGLEK